MTKNKQMSVGRQIDFCKIKPSFPCQIIVLNLSCWGCCGRKFKSKKEVEKDIEINTYEFSFLKKYDEKELLIFRDRLSKNKWDLTPSGICSNLIDFDNGCYACPLHNKINEIIPKEKFVTTNKDLRIGHCDEKYECETLILWKNFTKEQKEKYIKFLSKKIPINHYEYSTKNLNGILIKEFLNEKN